MSTNWVAFPPQRTEVRDLSSVEIQLNRVAEKDQSSRADQRLVAKSLHSVIPKTLVLPLRSSPGPETCGATVLDVAQRVGRAIFHPLLKSRYNPQTTKGRSTPCSEGV
jgi:hypothetical protein